MFCFKGNPKSDYTLYWQLGDLQRPLVTDDEHLIQGQTSEEGSREYDLEGACYQNEGLLQGGQAYKPRLPSSSPLLNQGTVFVFPLSYYSFG